MKKLLSSFLVVLFLVATTSPIYAYSSDDSEGQAETERIVPQWSGTTTDIFCEGLGVAGYVEWRVKPGVADYIDVYGALVITAWNAIKNECAKVVVFGNDLADGVRQIWTIGVSTAEAPRVRWGITGSGIVVTPCGHLIHPGR